MLRSPNEDDAGLQLSIAESQPPVGRSYFAQMYVDGDLSREGHSALLEDFMTVFAYRTKT